MLEQRRQCSKFVGRLVIAGCLLIAVEVLSADALVDPTKPANYGQQTLNKQVGGESYNLSSIFFGRAKKYAVINGQKVSEGDEFDGGIVRDIGKNSVTVVIGSEIKELKLERAKIDIVKR